MPSNTEEAQRKRNFDAVQQQARLVNAPPKNEPSPEQENPDETAPAESEASLASAPDKPDATGAAEQALEKSPEQKAAEEIIAKVPFGQALLRSVPVFGWLLGVMRESVVALWWVIPPFWAGASFLSIIGLRGFKLPWLPIKIPKTTAFECLLSQIVFYIEVSPFILVVVGLVALLVYVKQNPTSAIYGIFFGPFEFLKPLLPYVLGS